MKQINIAFATDDNYAEHCAVVMSSVLCSSKKDEEISFYILNSGLSGENREKLNRIPNVNFVEIDDGELGQLPENMFAHLKNNKVTYYRLKIASLLKNIDKILYLDSDVVVTTSFAPLFDLDMTGYALAAVPMSPKSGEFLRKLGMPEKSKYFNAGVLLLNLDFWRENNVERKLFEIKTEKLKTTNHFHDQDMLNIALHDKTLYLPLTWNSRARLANEFRAGEFECPVAEIKEAVKKPAIIHYTNKIKPWHREFPFPHGGKYLKYHKISPYKNNSPLFYLNLHLNHFLHRHVFSVAKKLELTLSLFKKLAFRNLKNKKVLVYGAGIYFEEFINEYKHLNIIGVSDMKFDENTAGEYLGYKKIPYNRINDEEFDAVLVAMQKPVWVIRELEKKVLKNKKIKAYPLDNLSVRFLVKNIWSE